MKNEKEMSVSQWFESLNAEQKHVLQKTNDLIERGVFSEQQQQAPLSSSPISVPPRRKNSNTNEYLSTSASPKVASALSQQTKKVNKEMRELYVKKTLQPNTRLQSAKCTVGEYLLQKWASTQNLPDGVSAHEAQSHEAQSQQP